MTTVTILPPNPYDPITFESLMIVDSRNGHDEAYYAEQNKFLDDLVNNQFASGISTMSEINLLKIQPLLKKSDAFYYAPLVTAVDLSQMTPIQHSRHLQRVFSAISKYVGDQTHDSDLWLLPELGESKENYDPILIHNPPGPNGEKGLWTNVFEMIENLKEKGSIRANTPDFFTEITSTGYEEVLEKLVAARKFKFKNANTASAIWRENVLKAAEALKAEAEKKGITVEELAESKKSTRPGPVALSLLPVKERYKDFAYSDEDRILLAKTLKSPEERAKTPEPDYKVCYFCSASNENPQLVDMTKRFALGLVENGMGGVSGAGGAACMGAFTDTLRDFSGWHAGANLPRIMVREPLVDHSMDAFHLTHDIYERMDYMLCQSTAFTIGPGGMGSVQELLALTLLAHHHSLAPDKNPMIDQETHQIKPIVVINQPYTYINKNGETVTEDYWKPLIEMAKIYGFDKDIHVAGDEKHALELHNQFRKERRDLIEQLALQPEARAVA